MSEEISKEDQEWLDALAGKSSGGLDALSVEQAVLVRNALLARRDSIEGDASNQGDRGLEEIRVRLKREGLMHSPQESRRESRWLGRAISILGFGSSSGGTRAVPIWGVAALLVVAAIITFQVRGPQPDEALVYRGDPDAAILVVEQPELRANELIAGVKSSASEVVVVNHYKEGGIRLHIKDSQAVRDYLLTQRIEAVPVNGIIKIDVVPVKK